MTVGTAAGKGDAPSRVPAPGAAAEPAAGQASVAPQSARFRKSAGARPGILVLLAMSLLVGACTAVKLGYENLPLMVEWQADRYLSLDDDQEALVSRHAKSLQRWHRRSLLPVYADFLRQVEEELGNPVTAGQVAGWRRRVVSAWLPLAEQAAPAVAEVAVTLRPEQLAHLQKALVKSNAKSAAEYRPADPAKREQARYERLVERAESFLGNTTSAQKDLMRTSAAGMARTEDAWWRARLARQQAVVALLTELATEKPPAAEATRRARRVLMGLFSHHEMAPGPGAVPPSGDPEAVDHRALRLTVETASAAGDDLTAGLLALATPEQRRHAVKRLDSYRQDFHLLAAR